MQNCLEEKFRLLVSLSNTGEHARKELSEATAELKQEKAQQK